MITIKRADQLQPGDVFSTDGYKVESACQLADGRVSVSTWLDASGGITKSAVLAPEFPCPIWTPDVWTVETGVRGARRINTNTYATEDDALYRAARWAASNSTGHYWAEVKSPSGEVVRRYNLDK